MSESRPAEASDGPEAQREHFQVTGPTGADTFEVGRPAGVSPISDLRDSVRSRIAQGLSILVAVMFAAYAFRVLFVAPPLGNAESEAFRTILAMLLTVYGTVLGFFFGTSR